MTLYHATTLKKYTRYQATGCILPPVRGWNTEEAARNWGKDKFRPIILKLIVSTAYPLPDHKRPDGRAYWSPDIGRWEDNHV